MLPDEVLKEIEKGPQKIGTTCPMCRGTRTTKRVSFSTGRDIDATCAVCNGAGRFPETSEQFATRIAELATKLEREACVKMCRHIDEITAVPALPEGMLTKSLAQECAEAIEARGSKA